MCETPVITSQVVRTILDSTYDAVIVHSIDGTILDVNNRMLEMFQVERDTALTLSIGQDISGPINNIAELPVLWGQAAQGTPMLFDWVARRPRDNSLFDVEVSLCRIKVVNDDAILATVRDISQRKKTELALANSEKKFRKLLLACAAIRDIAESKKADRKNAEDRIRYLAYYDSLTGLPNRNLLQDRLQSALELARRAKEKLAVLFMALDNFKVVNDSLGHAAGDELLQQVTKRLADTCCSADIISRFSGDEFVIVLTGSEHPLHAVQVAEKVARVLNTSFDIRGFSLRMTASIGICLYPDDGADADSLIKHAGVAMNNIKDSGRNNYRFYETELDVLAAERLSLVNDLRVALEQNEFVLYYQPKVNTISGELTGVEALLRWNHPKKGLRPPLQFIAELEETRLIIPVGEWILQEVCRQQREWVRLGIGQIPISVNISAVQFQQVAFLETVEKLLGPCENRPCIEFEVTEGVILKNPDDAIRVMKKLTDMGLQLSLDDFGTGFSSLSYLRRLPIDKLKIDQTFVREMMDNPKDIAIIKSILDLSKGLNLKTIAEGVETEEQLSVLRSMGCDEIQGYYFAKPMTNMEFAKWLATFQGAQRSRVIAAEG